ncbi:MAG: hypothetical protein JWQ14_604 [Adhaeribacter sp.]|nr:hypothetical protein [Adhaeribacter sp.]
MLWYFKRIAISKANCKGTVYVAVNSVLLKKIKKIEAGTEMKERILARAFELFRQYGIKANSMADIALDLGISKKTIYKYFADKHQLVAELFTAYLDEIKNIGSATNVNAIEEFCSTINSIIQKILCLPAAFFYDLKNIIIKLIRYGVNTSSNTSSSFFKRTYCGAFRVACTARM